MDTEAISQLNSIFPDDHVYLDPGDCWPYGYDNSKLHFLPDAVVFPIQHEQIVDCVLLCNRFKIPLTTRGRGTGTTGASVPSSGGIVLSTERMDKILNFDRGNRSARVQSGVTNLTLQKFLSKHGFFWAPDPSSAEYCSIGGNLACNAAGPRAIKYGSTRDNTLQLKAVTGEGKTIVTGSKTSKGVVGLDLTRLLIGSEGSLAIISEAELKVLPLAPCKCTLRALYTNHKGACEAIEELMSQPHTPSAIEFMDHHALDLIRRFGNIPLHEKASVMLMVEADGDDESLQISVAIIEEALRNSQLCEVQLAKSDKDSNALWQARKALSPILRNVAPSKINEDVVVPVPNLGNLIDELDRLSAKYDLPIINFGHAGNGNLHVNILYDEENDQENKHATACLDDIFSIVLKLDGTISGEHGIGIIKRDHVDKELGRNEIDLMKKIKLQFDPNQILNPNSGLPR